MKGMKGAIIIASVVATAAAVGACRKQVTHDPMKFGTAETTAEQVK